MNKTHLLVVVLIALLFSACNKEKEEPSFDGSLSEVINAYRVEKGLTEINISTALTAVAQAHVKDLADNQPDGGECNLHSWSGKGSWTACCYTSDHAQAQCMWDKPREITDYQGNGYEIAAWSSNEITANEALALWQKSEGHHNVILNKDIWANNDWNAIGAAIYKGYAVVWFGKEADTSK